MADKLIALSKFIESKIEQLQSLKGEPIDIGFEEINKYKQPLNKLKAKKTHIKNVLT